MDDQVMTIVRVIGKHLVAGLLIVTLASGIFFVFGGAVESQKVMLVFTQGSLMLLAGMIGVLLMTIASERQIAEMAALGIYALCFLAGVFAESLMTSTGFQNRWWLFLLLPAAGLYGLLQRVTR